MSDIPIILFPVGGCEPAGKLTREQVDAKLAALRSVIRQQWTTDGVQAVISFMEISTARLTKESYAKGSGQHEQGEASGANYLLSALVMVANSSEGAPETQEQP